MQPFCGEIKITKRTRGLLICRPSCYSNCKDCPSCTDRSIVFAARWRPRVPHPEVVPWVQKTTLQTASQSVQPFFHSSPEWPIQRRTTLRTTYVAIGRIPSSALVIMTIEKVKKYGILWHIVCTRCGIVRCMSIRSVCLSIGVSVCWSRPWSLQKRLNKALCPLACYAFKCCIAPFVVYICQNSLNSIDAFHGYKQNAKSVRWLN